MMEKVIICLKLIFHQSNVPCDLTAARRNMTSIYNITLIQTSGGVARLATGHGQQKSCGSCFYLNKPSYTKDVSQRIFSLQ